MNISHITRALVLVSVLASIFTVWSSAAMADDMGGSEAVPVLARASAAEPVEITPAEITPPAEQRAWDAWIGDAIAGTGNGLEKAASYGLDLIVLRPMGAAATISGFGFWIASVPLSVPTAALAESWEIFVTNPATYTFERPLGRF